jgi:hypothetical protein
MCLAKMLLDSKSLFGALRNERVREPLCKETSGMSKSNFKKLTGEMR